MENNKNPLGLRKGAWTKEEDDLLRQCVEKYGEGKWHQVPLRAGLNRCRKSCRLRWVNYLRPNIKRGCFDEAEVDLIIRLHKLLGNRWSLIAGRIPGRTASDVKNFWNTHMEKKPAASHNKNSNKDHVTVIKDHAIIKPRPRTLSFKALHQAPPNNEVDHCATRHHESERCSVETSWASSSQQQQKLQDESIRWWRSLLEESATDDRYHLDDEEITLDLLLFPGSNNCYGDYEEEEEEVDKILWSGPYGNDKQASSCNMHVDDDDVDACGGTGGI